MNMVDDVNDFTFTTYLDSIISQIESQDITDKSPIDHLQPMFMYYDHFVKNNTGIADDESLALLHANFINTLHRIMSKLYEVVGITEEDYDINVYETAQIRKWVYALYYFVICNRYENVVDFIKNYILKNKKNIITDLKTKHSKDLINGHKKNLDVSVSHDTAVLVMSINDVIDDIAESDEINYEEFFKHMIKDNEGRLDNYTLSEHDFFVEQPFVKSYIASIWEDPTLRTFVFIELREFIFNNFS